MSECWGGHKPGLSLTEEMVQRPDHMGMLRGWRRFRIEYGFECSCPEGVIYVPPEINPTRLEEALRAITRISPASYEDLTDDPTPEDTEDTCVNPSDSREAERRLRIKARLRELCAIHDRLQDSLYPPLPTEWLDGKTLADKELSSL